MLRIDGSKGEGGGQILRSSLALSALTGRPFVLDKIRAGRSRPGLRPQHLAAVRLAGALCGAEVEGDEVDSDRLVFHPGPVKPGRYRVDVGTAGSVTLLAQAVLVPALLCEGTVVLEMIGGTDVAMAPPIDYLLEVVVPYFRRLGRIEGEVVRRGFHPKGEGVVRLRVEKAAGAPYPLVVEEPAVWLERTARVVVSSELAGAAVAERIASGLDVDQVRSQYVESASPGAVITLWASSAQGYKVGATGLGRRGLPSEKLAAAASGQFRERLQHRYPVEENLADQLVPLLALLGGRLSCQTVSRHCLTNIEICAAFTGARFEVTGNIVQASNPYLDL